MHHVIVIVESRDSRQLRVFAGVVFAICLLARVPRIVLQPPVRIVECPGVAQVALSLLDRRALVSRVPCIKFAKNGLCVYPDYRTVDVLKYLSTSDTCVIVAVIGRPRGEALLRRAGNLFDCIRRPLWRFAE